MRVFWTLVLVFVCAGAVLAEDLDPNVIWAQRAVDAYVAAVRDRDLPAMTELLTEDFVADYRFESDCGGTPPVSHGKCEHLLGWAGQWLVPDSLSCSISRPTFVMIKPGEWLGTGAQFFLTIHFTYGPMKVVHTKEFLIVEDPSGRSGYQIRRITTIIPPGPPQ